MERKLATIRKIKELKPIKDADNIELAIIDGWQCVVKKGDFEEGELAIYFEIDSLLPEIPQFSFLANRGVKTNADGSIGYRLKTIKLKGEISQGLLLPLHSFELDKGLIFIDEDVDLTEILNIKKFEPAISAQLQGQVRGNFPGFLHKTDAERIQNVYGKYKHEYNDDTTWEVSEKLDGTSATFYFKDGEFGVCSRNLNLKETEENTYWKIAREYKIEEFLLERGNYAIQGEIIGEGIQKNPLKIKGQQLRIFNVFDINKNAYLPYFERLVFLQSYALFLYGDPARWEELHVPILNEEAKKLFYFSIEALLEEAEGKSKINPEVGREGLVFKNIHDPYINFKVISNKYLLKHE